MIGNIQNLPYRTSLMYILYVYAFLRVKELGHSNKQPPSGNGAPTEARTADENFADDIPPGSTDLQLLHQNVVSTADIL